MIRPILLTGASGFLGSHVLTSLTKLDLGGRVHLFLRKHPTPDSVLGCRFRDEGFTLEDFIERTHLVDLVNEDVFKGALAQLASISRDWVVIHLAAIINPQGDLAEQERVNFDRTRELLAWSNEHASKFIYTSSVVAFGATPFATMRDESDYDRYHFLNRLDGYSLSKRKAHNTVLRESKIPTYVFCPGIIHGSYEQSKTSRGHLQKILEGKMRWLPGGGGAFVSLANVSEVIVQAAIFDGEERGIFVKVLTDVCLPYLEYFQLYRDCAKLERLKLHSIPSILVWPLAGLYKLLKIFGKDIAMLGKALQALMFYYFKNENSLEEGKSLLRRAITQSLELKN